MDGPRGTGFSAADVPGGPLSGGGTNFRVTGMYGISTSLRSSDPFPFSFFISDFFRRAIKIKLQSVRV